MVARLAASDHTPDHDPPEAPLILCVARCAAEKGHLVLLDALVLLRDRGCAAHCTFVGDGPLRPALTARAAQLSLHDSVTFMGAVAPEQLADFYRSTRVVVLPSFSEGVPVALMEAMMYGRAVVATRVGGVPELIEDGVRGRLVSPGDAAELAQGLYEVLSNPIMARRMARNAAQFVRREFNIDTTVRHLVRLLEGARPPRCAKTQLARR